MEAFTVTTRLNLADWKILVRQVQKRAWRRAGLMIGRWIAMGGWLCAAGVAAWLTVHWPRTFNVESMAIGAVLMLSYLLIAAARHRRGLRPGQDSRALDPSEYRFSSTGFEIRRPCSVSQNEWPVVREITRTPAHIILWLDHMTGFLIRIADLPAPMTADEAVSRLTAWKTGAGPVSPTSSR